MRDSTAPTAHLVERLTVDAGFGAGIAPGDAETRLVACAQGPLLRVIDEVFDACCPPDEQWRLDELEIDLGELPAADWEVEAPRLLRERLRRVLEELRAPGGVSASGRATGLRIKDTLKPGTPHAPLPAGSEELALSRLDHFRNAAGSSTTASVRSEMQKTMQRHCAVFRTDELLTEGRQMIRATYDRMKDIGIKDRSLIWNTDLVETLELDNLIEVARATDRKVSLVFLVGGGVLPKVVKRTKPAGADRYRVCIPREARAAFVNPPCPTVEQARELTLREAPGEPIDDRQEIYLRDGEALLERQAGTSYYGVDPATVAARRTQLPGEPAPAAR